MDEFEIISNLYRNGHNISDISKHCNFNKQKVRKILITTGDLETPLSKKINNMYDEGIQVAQIAEQLEMSVSMVNSYVPYQKGAYKSSTPSDNALRIRKSREKTDEVNHNSDEPAVPVLHKATTKAGKHMSSSQTTNIKIHRKTMVHVWGEQAVFQRAEIKHDVYSYDIITPSAARGILEAIYWHPGMRWIVDNIYVVNPIRRMADKITLKDVDYIIEAHFEMTNEAGPNDNEGKFKDIFSRRLRRKQPFKPIYFGSKEYPAQFEEYNGDISNIKSYYRQTIKDLGIMFYDFDYQNTDDPLFFRATLKYGVLSLHDVAIFR